MANIRKEYKTVKVEKEDGIGWCIFNRPEKRNAMNPQLHYDMLEALTEFEVDKDTKVSGDHRRRAELVRGTGSARILPWDGQQSARTAQGELGVAGMALAAALYLPKPTIAMVNGFCFGGAFTPLIACDFAIAAEDATFGLSEVNWGIFPGGLVSRVLADAMCYRDAMWAS